MSDDFPTREQHEAISALAIEHGTVTVSHVDAERRLVAVDAGLAGTAGLVILDENGVDVTAEHGPEPTVYVEFPIAVVRTLLGDGRVDAALAVCPPSQTRRFALARTLGEPFVDEVRSMAARLENLTGA